MDNQRQFMLGIFFIVALSILAFYTLFLTDVHLFSKPKLETVLFPDAYGLREGNPVMVLGHRIGRVKSLEFDINAPQKERIRVVLSLDQPVELLSGARITIKESTLLGGRHIDIYPGDPGGPPLVRDDEGALFGDVERNPIAALGDLGQLFTDNRDSVRNIISDLEVLIDDVREGRGTVGRLLRDEEMALDIAATVANLKQVTTDLEAGSGLLGALINDQQMAGDFRGIVESFHSIGADLEAGKGLAGRLIYDVELADTVSRGLASIANIAQKMERGEGLAGRVLSDEDLAVEVESMVDNLVTASADLRDVLAQVRDGEGTVGKIVMDEELYEQVMTGLGLVNRSLEDYREAAPITTFTSVFFAAF